MEDLDLDIPVPFPVEGDDRVIPEPAKTPRAPLLKDNRPLPKCHEPGCACSLVENQPGGENVVDVESTREGNTSSNASAGDQIGTRGNEGEVGDDGAVKDKNGDIGNALHPSGVGKDQGKTSSASSSA